VSCNNEADGLTNDNTLHAAELGNQTPSMSELVALYNSDKVKAVFPPMQTQKNHYRADELNWNYACTVMKTEMKLITSKATSYLEYIYTKSIQKQGTRVITKSKNRKSANHSVESDNQSTDHNHRTAIPNYVTKAMCSAAKYNTYRLGSCATAILKRNRPLRALRTQQNRGALTKP
jgi:hypothetical protein